ncbi:hypothetical protein MNV49_004826 [Pseudohyphozyma bogoriensis]|nr:hypothetical protein MNV49_004826 [Pseudohyphozyma bogoriensis]
MSSSIYNGPPAGYVEPKFVPFLPRLYAPIGGTPQYLYNPYQIWRFTVLWTLLLFGLPFAIAGLLCVPIFARRHFRLALLAPVVFTVVGLLGAFISATVVGYAIAALYNAAYLRMSTFVPALFGGIQTLTLLLGLFTLRAW